MSAKKLLIIYFTGMLLFTSCGKTYTCYCTDKYPQYTNGAYFTSESFGTEYKATSKEKALEKCKSEKEVLNTDSTGVTCTIQ